ncbi:XRE family transcriptional regulator [Syntrophomonas curvata]
MAEKKEYSRLLVDIGTMLAEKRKLLGKPYHSRESFIEKRSAEIFNNVPWISQRHLANLERGKNWISVELLIHHAYALEMDPMDLFREILEVYNSSATNLPLTMEG